MLLIDPEGGRSMAISLFARPTRTSAEATKR